MGAVGARVEALVEGLRETPWPEGERVVAWAGEAGDDPHGAWSACERADDLLALAAAYGVAVGPALAHAAALVREASRVFGLRESRVTRVAFAAEQGGARAQAARIKLLDDAKALLVDAQKKVVVVTKDEASSKPFENHASMEVLRASGFLALAVVTAGEAGPPHANVAHAIRQLAAAFAAHRLARDPSPIESPEQFQKCIDAAAAEELSRLGPNLRAALAADFDRALAAAPV
jgi:hypothetical protein